MIDLGFERKQGNDHHTVLFTEVLHHAHICHTREVCSNGHDELLKSIKAALKMKWTDTEDSKTANDENMDEVVEPDESAQVNSIASDTDRDKNELDLDELIIDVTKTKHLPVYGRPLIIHGRRCGKVTLMSKVAVAIERWLRRKSVKILRFLGTSITSSSIRDTLVSICEQIQVAYGIADERLDLTIAMDFTVLVMYFKVLLTRINTDQKPLVIILDAIEQLDDEHNVFTMHWLPVTLPQNVYIIVSMVPEAPCFENVRTLLDESRLIKVDSLTENATSVILDTWNKSTGRTLNSLQRFTVLNRFKHCSEPLYLNLCFEQSKLWHSYTDREEWILFLTTSEMIEHMFDQLEIQHGKSLVGAALGKIIFSLFSVPYIKY